ncbi:MFS transporter, partial [Frankia sp. CpI1-P]
MNPPFVEQVADGCGAGQLAPVSGPVLGGLLIDTWGWRGAFLVNIPIVLIVLILTWRWFPADEQRSDQPLDAVD